MIRLKSSVLLQRFTKCPQCCNIRLTSGCLSARNGFRAKRGVTTWSPLASIFNSQPRTQTISLRLRKENVGLFGIPELQDYTGFYLLQQNACSEAEELVREAVNPDRKRKLVTVFDELSDTLCKVADMADFVRIAHPDKRFTQAAEEACVSISGLVEKLNTNVDIHSALKHVIEHGDKFPCDDIDNRVAQLFMFDFEQSGIHLPKQTREDFVKLNEQILMLGTYFQQGCHKPISIAKDQLPEHLKYAFAVDGNSVTIAGLFSDNHNDLVREAAYRIFLYPDPHQQELLESLLSSRAKLANMVGFPTYAHRALRGTLAESPENVLDFLQTLAEKVRPKAEADHKELSAVKHKYKSLSKEVMPWDPPYYTTIAKHDKCLIDNVELAPYFSLGCCMEGLDMLFSSLFGVTLVHQEPQYGEMWCGDVHKLKVVHETEGVLGYIYCDMFERPGKPHQDCHFTVRGGRLMDDATYQAPVVVLMLNLLPPRGKMPSLLTSSMVENLFHEFGHAMHSMLGRTRYQHVTGTRCPTDFAEVPSVLMEYFATDYRVLSKFARHWQTGEPLPEDKINNLCTANNMFAASDIQLQVFYSMLDQVYHGSHPLEKSTTQILEELQAQYCTLPYVEGTAWQLRFGHFVGYGAKYYSYLMSRAVASKLWQQCFKQDPFNREMGERYRNKMLVHGGGVHPRDLVQDMLNETPTSAVLVDALMVDLEQT